ncbi:MAG: hypothetical protein KME16_12045 [Scytolyngbya sp. HA4215-MV1]|jgi:hypothetical protein|nr:hypothetical protein [Scytolyngbya sp. HA4215-MV1]
MKKIVAQVLNRKFSVLFLFIISSILIGYAYKALPIRQGDGYEYALILQSFFNHLSPDIRQVDINSLLKIIQTQPSSYDATVLQKVLKAFNQHKNEIYLGILRSNHGEYFGYHFWLYSFISLPAKWLLAILRLNELKAFQLTNTLWMILTLKYVLLFSKQSPFFRWSIALLYVLGCSFFYLKWPHPEVFLAACILIASCAFLDCRFHLAVGAATLATLQNPSVIFLVASVLLFFIAKDFRLSAFKNLVQWLKPYLWMVLIAATSFIPYFFYYYHYKKLNLITVRGFVNPSLISSDRFFSTLFDWNQGLIVGFPGILIGVAIVLFYRLIQIFLHRNQPVLRSVDALLPAFFLMLLPTLSQTNWNHGQEIFSRYAFWTTMVLIVWFVANLETFRGFIQFSVLAVALGLQLLPNEIFFRHAEDGHYLKMKPQATWFLTHLPGWYNPDPEIFAERTRGYERFGETIAPNPIDAPFIFLDRTGKIRKILLYQAQALQTESRLCGINGKLASNDGDNPVATLLAKARFNPQGWGYLNGSFQCALPLSLRFSDGGNARNFTIQGWSKPDAEGSWIKSRESSLVLPIVPPNLRQVRLRLKLRVDAKLVKDTPQLAVVVNGQQVSQWQLENPGQVSEYEAVIPSQGLSARSPLALNFHLLPSSQSIPISDAPGQVKVMEFEITTSRL